MFFYNPDQFYSPMNRISNLTTTNRILLWIGNVFLYGVTMCCILWFFNLLTNDAGSCENPWKYKESLSSHFCSLVVIIKFIWILFIISDKTEFFCSSYRLKSYKSVRFQLHHNFKKLSQVSHLLLIPARKL